MLQKIIIIVEGLIQEVGNNGHQAGLALGTALIGVGIIYEAMKGLRVAEQTSNLAEKAKRVADFGRTVESGVGISIREQLLNKVENPKLKNVIIEIYGPGTTAGDKGLADAVKQELERVTNLENIIKKENLNSEDLEIAKELLEDLKKSLGDK